jgi:hypothetical protein
VTLSAQITVELVYCLYVSDSIHICPFGSNSWDLLALAYNAATGKDRAGEGNL